MRWLHNLLKGALLTTALFVFQACFWIPQPPLYEDHGAAPMRFSLVSRACGEPLQDIQVKGSLNKEWGYQVLGQTDADGCCEVDIPYIRNEVGPFLRFEDPQGRVAAKDTMLADLRMRTIVIQLNDNE